MKKIFWCILLCFACGNHPEGHRSDVIRLTYWSANNQDEIYVAEQLVAEWNVAHPGIQVKHQPIPESRSSEEVILAAVVGRTTPDIYSNMWPGDVESYVRAGTLVALDSLAGFDSLSAARFTPERLRESYSNDGHVYQILWKTNPVMMVYNKKMFAEAGLNKPPSTYEDFLEAGERIGRDTDGDGYVDRWVGITQILVAWWQRFFDYYALYIAASDGKTLLADDAVAFDNEVSVEVFRFLKTLFDRGYFPRERMDARADVFMNGIVATRFTGPWTITQLEKYAPEGFDYDFAPLPRPRSSSGPAYTYGDYKSIVIFSNTKYPEESWEFVKHLVSRKSDLNLLSTAHQLPIRKTILQDSLFTPYFVRNPKMRAFAGQSDYVRGVDHSPVLREIFDAISQEFEACVIYGTKTPEDAVRSAAYRAHVVMME